MSVVRQLRRNNRSRSHLTIDLQEERNDPSALARAVRRNTTATQFTVKLLGDDEPATDLEQWNPFWRAVASHRDVTHLCLQQGLVVVGGGRQQQPGRELFCPPMLRQALGHLQGQTTPTALCHISLCGFNLTWDRTSGCAASGDGDDTPVSLYLDHAESITTVTLVRCGTRDPHQAQKISQALKRKANLQTLELLDLEETLSLVVLQNLTTTSSAAVSRSPKPPTPPTCLIKKLSFSYCSYSSFAFRMDDDENDDDATSRRSSPGEVARAVQQLLESTDSLETLQLQGPLSRDICAPIVQGVRNSKSVSAFRFKNWFSHRSEDYDSLSNLLLKSSKVRSLTVVGSNFPPQQMLEACLRRPELPLRRLEIQQDQAVSLNNPAFVPMQRLQIRSLVNAIQNSRLEDLVLPTISDRETFLLVTDCCLGATKYLQKFSAAIAFDSRTIKEELFTTLRRNFSLRTVQVTRLGHNIFYNFSEKERLAFYMDRNTKLDAFVQNPACLPFELWPLAVHCAKEAGHDTLYRSLVRVLGSQVETVEGMSSLAASRMSNRALMRKRKRSNDDSDE